MWGNLRKKWSEILLAKDFFNFIRNCTSLLYVHFKFHPYLLKRLVPWAVIYLTVYFSKRIRFFCQEQMVVALEISQLIPFNLSLCGLWHRLRSKGLFNRFVVWSTFDLNIYENNFLYLPRPDIRVNPLRATSREAKVTLALNPNSILGIEKINWFTNPTEMSILYFYEVSV